MIAPRTKRFLFLFCFGLPFLYGNAQESAQSTPTPNPQAVIGGNISTQPILAPNDRLKQLQQTFDSKLAQLHRPLLLEHLEALSALKEKLEDKGSLTELALLRLEISETQAKLHANRGISFEYKDPQLSILTTDQAQSLPVMPKMVLNADQAEGAALGSPTITLGKTQWIVQNLPAGNYQLYLVYQPISTASPIQVRWTALGQTHVATVGNPAENNYSTEVRSVTLGELKVTGRAPAPFPFALESLSVVGPPLHVRHLILSVSPDAAK